MKEAPQAPVPNSAGLSASLLSVLILRVGSAPCPTHGCESRGDYGT